MNDSPRHPIQPIVMDPHGVARFKKNKIVEYLLDQGEFNMNDIARIEFPREDRVQFAQLIGYSVCGFGDLGYVSDEDYEAASKEVQRVVQESKRMESPEHEDSQ